MKAFRFMSRTHMHTLAAQQGMYCTGRVYQVCFFYLLRDLCVFDCLSRVTMATWSPGTLWIILVLQRFGSLQPLQDL